MKPQELRIGNIVKIDDEYLGPIEGKVTSLNEKAEVELLLSVNKGNIRYFRCGSDDIFPIPITEELLLKIGFKKHVDLNNAPPVVRQGAHHNKHKNNKKRDYP